MKRSALTSTDLGTSGCCDAGASRSSSSAASSARVVGFGTSASPCELTQKARVSCGALSAAMAFSAAAVSVHCDM